MTDAPLILLSHGSRHPEAAGGIAALAEAVSDTLGVLVCDAHLDFSDDTLPAVARRLADEGHEQAVVIALLFSTGYHARHDVPAEITEATSASGLSLVNAGTLGAGADIAELIAARFQSERPAAAELVIYPVGSSASTALADYERLQSLVAGLVSARVLVHPATRAPFPLEELELSDAHLIPLFVTEGLLLDKARHHLPPHTTISSPLGTDLAPLIAARYRQAVSP